MARVVMTAVLLAVLVPTIAATCGGNQVYQERP